MTLEECLKGVEGPAFDAELNRLTRVYEALAFLEDHATVKELRTHLRNDLFGGSGAMETALQRLQNLVSIEAHPDEVHPHDAAIAAILFAISKEGSVADRTDAIRLQRSMFNPNWATKVSLSMPATGGTKS